MSTPYRIPVEETFSWQRPVLDKDLATPPVSTVKGDRYIVAASGTGAWSGQDGKIAWYDGAAWRFDAPTGGWTTYVLDEDKAYTYNGTAWGFNSTASVVSDGTNTTTAAQVREAYDRRGSYDAQLGAIIMNL